MELRISSKVYDFEKLYVQPMHKTLGRGNNIPKSFPLGSLSTLLIPKPPKLLDPDYRDFDPDYRDPDPDNRDSDPDCR